MVAFKILSNILLKIHDQALLQKEPVGLTFLIFLLKSSTADVQIGSIQMRLQLEAI